MADDVLSLPAAEVPCMLIAMSKVRVVLVVEEEIRDALRLESALTRQDMAEVISNLVRTHLASAIESIRARRGEESKAKKKPKPDS